MRFRNVLLLVLVAVGVTVLAAPALATFICHPDPAGTRKVTVHGVVQGYAVRGGEVAIAVERGRCARRVLWRPFLKSGETISSSKCVDHAPFATPGVGRSIDGRNGAAVQADGAVTITRGGAVITTIFPRDRSASELIALRKDRLLVLTAATGPDSPAELSVYRIPSGKPLQHWPVPYEAVTLDTYGGTAVFSTARRGGLYALRLADGSIALIGANQRVDFPQIERPGVVYEDDLYKSKDGKGRIVLKYVPAQAVTDELAAAGRPVRLNGMVHALSMDGPRVAVAVTDPRSRCDRVYYWNVPWNYVAGVTMPKEHEATCPRDGARPKITALSIGGIRSAWILSSRSGNQLVTATSASCTEHIISTSGSVRALAADGSLFAYGSDAAVGAIGGETRPRGLVLDPAQKGVVSVAADNGRVAVLHADGAAQIFSRTGLLLLQLHLDAPRALALRAGRLLVWANGTLAVREAKTGELLATWNVPRGLTAAPDAHYGVAVLTAGRKVYALSLSTGRMALIARAPTRVMAQIEAPGIAYAYNTGGHGVLRFVPLTVVERALR